ncbi:MAG: hypothetical protein R3190_16260, partial [Thermoanaerobaculia bacterium]|nr:hypothetical protein [Thermoanaerobaculia bacterium]
VYPVINPDSGGATGSSLLGSSLGIVAVVLLLPPMLGLRRSLPHRGVRHVAGLLALHFLAFLLLDHGNRSHHQLDQVVALATLFVWLPLLYRYLGSWVWPPESRGWLRAAAVWGCLLLLSGFAAFLPGLLERWKFTNVLVAHAHVALAGLVSCLDVLVLQSLRRQGTRDVFATGSGIWHAGLAIQVAALFAVGLLEAGDPGLLFRPAALVDLLYGLRWIGGALMLAAAWRWLQAARTSVAGEAAP